MCFSNGGRKLVKGEKDCEWFSVLIARIEEDENGGKVKSSR